MECRLVGRDDDAAAAAAIHARQPPVPVPYSMSSAQSQFQVRGCIIVIHKAVIWGWRYNNNFSLYILWFCNLCIQLEEVGGQGKALGG